MGQTDKAIVVTCIDYRVQEAINKWIAKHLRHRMFDRVALGGGVKDLKIILGQIDTAVRLHHIKKVILVNHEDCGAYGKNGTFKKIAKDLQKAQAAVNKIYPSLKVDTFYLHLDGIFESVSATLLKK